MSRFEERHSSTIMRKIAGSTIMRKIAGGTTTDLTVDRSYVEDRGDTVFVMIEEIGGGTPADASIWLDRDEAVAFAYQLLRRVEEFDQRNAD